MYHPDLHWIAEQLHSGREPEGINFGSATLNPEDKLEMVAQALGAFPTAASLWAEANEIFLPERDVPDNIQPFNRFPRPGAPGAPRAARPVANRAKVPTKPAPLLVHFKLKSAPRRRKQSYVLELEWREKALQNAYRDFLEGRGHWAAVERVHLEYLDWIGGANDFIKAVWADQGAYYRARSKAWRNSPGAWAYQGWMEGWKQSIPAPSLPSRAGGELRLDASALLRGFPDEPAR